MVYHGWVGLVSNGRLALCGTVGWPFMGGLFMDGLFMGGLFMDGLFMDGLFMDGLVFYCGLVSCSWWFSY